MLRLTLETSIGAGNGPHQRYPLSECRQAICNTHIGKKIPFSEKVYISCTKSRQEEFPASYDGLPDK